MQTRSERPENGRNGLEGHDPRRLRDGVPGERRGSVRTGDPRVHGFVSASSREDSDTGTVSGGRRRASGGRRTDGSDVGAAGSECGVDRPYFDDDVPASGYRWWYLDGLSDDGRAGFTVIAFVGSVFSPYYARARRRGPADPEQHCAINVALYGPDRDHWAMTERGRRFVARTPHRFTVGPSSLSFEDDSLIVQVDEITVPWLRRLRGEIRLRAPVRFDRVWSLDSKDRHHWQPYAPAAEVEVDFLQPELSWRGSGYLDGNWGDEPLEDGFSRWHWSRAVVDGGARLSYDAVRLDGTHLNLGVHYGDNGTIERRAGADVVSLPTTGWRVERSVRSEKRASVKRTAEDTPFYARTMVAGRLDDRTVPMMQESLDLDRFASRWVQTLLPFRMPRRT